MEIIVSFIVIVVFVVIITVVQRSKKEDEREMERLEIEHRCRVAKEKYDDSTTNNSAKVEVPEKTFVTQNERLTEFGVTSEVRDKSDFQLHPSALQIEDHFKNNWYDGQMDFSELSPSEARRRIKEAQEDGDWLDQEEYYGLIDAVAAAKDEKYLAKIEEMRPEQVQKWFEQNNRREIKMSTVVWIAVAEKVAPIHETFLIDSMRNKSSKSIDGFVHARKTEGYFFTKKAYRLANRIYSGEFDKKEMKTFLRQKLNIDDI